jgi:hypothetical protein
MEKLIYLLGRTETSTPERLLRAVTQGLPQELSARGARHITFSVADLDVQVRELAPQRFFGAWDHFCGAIHLWLDALDFRSEIEKVLFELFSAFHSYLVTESIVQPFKRTWKIGERRPGLTQFTAGTKPEAISEKDFYYNWQVKHSASSFRLHPRRWSYVRNSIARSLSNSVPQYSFIVLEHFREMSDFTDDSRYFGGQEAIAEMIAEIPGFCDVDRMISGPASEYYFE